MLTPIKKPSGWLVLVSLCVMVSGCGLLPVMGLNKKAGGTHRTFFIEPRLPEPQPHSGVCGNLLVGELDGAPGFRSPRIAYTTTPLNLQYYAFARWTAGFGLLLESPLQKALQNTGQFAHVMTSSSTADTDLRLEFSDLRLLQRFSSPEADTSTVSLSVDVRLLQTQPRSLLDSRRFEFAADAAPNAAGGVTTTNELAAQLIEGISDFAVSVCKERTGT